MNRTRFTRFAALASLVASFVAGCGGGGGGTPPPPPTTAPPRLELFAGGEGGAGNADGTAAFARFSSILDIAADPAGNLYVADNGNFSVRRIDAAGNVTTLAGSGAQGSAGGIGREASFFFIAGIAVDAASNVYVADTGNKNIRKISPAGVVTTLAGGGVTGSVDGVGSAAQFLGPASLAVDAQGNVYVADGSAIRKVTATGVVTTFAGSARESGFRDGPGSAARFVAPTDIAIDAGGRLYVADNNTVRAVSAAGDVLTLAGRPGVGGPSIDGAGGDATFNYPLDITVDAQGNALVLEVGSTGISMRQVTPGGSVSTVARLPGYGLTALAYRASGLAIGASTAVYAVGQDSTLIPIAGTTSAFEAADGAGTDARFRAITGMAVDAMGNLLVAESFPPALRRVAPDAKVTTVANMPNLQPRMIVADDRAGNTYLGNADCPRGFCVGLVTRIGGNTQTEFLGSLPDGGTIVPAGLAADASGNVYVSDNYFRCVVYRVGATRAVEVLAGQSRGACSPGGSVDGNGAAARFTRPGALATGAAGDLYILDGHAVRRITAAGAVSTLAGKADEFGDSDGTGPAARFRDPLGLAVDSAGNVYVADTGNSLVRTIAPDGTVTTIAGVKGVVGFMPGALPGVLDRPVAVAVVGRDLFVAMSRSIAVIHNRP